MTLAEWVTLRGKGELARLTRATGLAYTTIFYARERGVVKIVTAEKISAATGGVVSVGELRRRPKGVAA